MPRISVGTKAKAKVGPFSRGGLGRGAEAVPAADHDTHPTAVLAPAGILEVASGQLTPVFGTSRDTSDFVADAPDLWWADRRVAHPSVRRILVDLDNGPSVASNRTQFLHRMVGFADRNRATVGLAYDPPYHGKCNRVERRWGVPESHWNGTLLDTPATVLEWARTMTWQTLRPVVHSLDRVYATGVRWTKAAFRPIAARLERSPTLPKRSLVIRPGSG